MEESDEVPSMNTHHCCQTETPAHESARGPASRWRRGGEVAGWIVPSVILALLPKCPACVVAYVALATGLGISISAGAYLRILVVTLCVASLGLVAAKRLRVVTLRPWRRR